MTRRRIVLVLPTETYRAEAFFTAAAALDLEIVVATEAAPPLAPEMESRLVVVDLDEPQRSARAIAAVGERTPIDGIVGVDDQGVLLAAHAAELVGLAHNPPDAVAATRDKIDLRQILTAWSVPQPDHAVLPGDATASDIVTILRRIGTPVVLKPVTLSASTGVIRADTAAQAIAAEARIRDILVAHGRTRGEPLLVESFVSGPEVSVEGLLRGGTLEILALFDKPDRLDGPFFEETIYTTPSRLPERHQRAIADVSAAACRALGLREGPVHAEVRLRDSEPDPVVLEVAARSIGGLCSRTLRFGAGISLEEVILRHALGEPSDSLGRDTASGVMMLPIPASGRLRAINGIEKAAAVPGIVDVELSAPIGSHIQQLPEGGRYLGFVFARADTPAEVETALRRAHEHLDIEVRPDFDGTGSDRAGPGHR